MTTREMNRRFFLKTAALAAGLAAVGRLPVLAAPAGTRVDADETNIALQGYQGYVRAQTLPNAGSKRLVYSYLHKLSKAVKGRDAPPEKYADEVGRLEIVQAAPDRLTVKRETQYSAETNWLEAEISHAQGRLQSWTILTGARDRDGKEIAAASLKEKGEIRDGAIVIRDAFGERRTDASGPVYCQWTLPLALAGMTLPSHFDLLQD
ncbi:hypothetical protein HQ520_13870, partial [bacterium]|nr:hypothetical protein [bacterium]